MSLTEADLGKPKRILVIPRIHKYPEPWLIDHLAGIVTEQGGILSKAAIVARHAGIPAVCGVDAATHTIANGQEITLDGNAGTVTISSLP